MYFSNDRYCGQIVHFATISDGREVVIFRLPGSRQTVQLGLGIAYTQLVCPD